MLIFDGDCAFCTSCVDAAQRIAPQRIAMQPYQRADLAALGIDASTCAAALQYRDDRGTWHSGSEAIAGLLRACGGIWWLPGRLLQLPGIRRVAAGTYAWVAANRHRLPGGTPACQQPHDAP